MLILIYILTLMLYFDFDVENNDKDLKLKAGDHVKILNIRILLQKDTLQIVPKKVLLLRWTEEIVRTVDKTESGNTNERQFRIEKVIKQKGDKLCLSWMDMKIHLIVGLIKKKSKGKIKIYRIFKYFTTSTGSDQILAQNLKGCQKKVLNFLISHIIFLLKNLLILYMT